MVYNGLAYDRLSIVERMSINNSSYASIFLFMRSIAMPEACQRAIRARSSASCRDTIQYLKVLFAMADISCLWHCATIIGKFPKYTVENTFIFFSFPYLCLRTGSPRKFHEDSVEHPLQTLVQSRYRLNNKGGS